MDALARFERYLTGERGKSPATRSSYLADARLLLELAGGMALSTLGTREIRAFVRQLKQKGHDPRSIARRLSAWRAWFNLLMREGVLASNPAEAIRAPRATKKLPRPVDVDSAAGFLDGMAAEDGALASRDHAMYELAYSSGLRVSELVGLDLGDLQADGLLRVLGKGGKQRLVPVGEAARRAIAGWLPQRQAMLQAGENALFLNRYGQRMSRRAVHLRLTGWCDKLGLADKLHPHRLRHACASHFLQGSGDLRATQELLGHASITSTQIYTQLDFQRLSAVYDQAHPRAKNR